MKNLIVILSILILSCTKDDQTEPSNQKDVVELDLPFKIQNESGLDLLNPDNADSYSQEDIKVFDDPELQNDISGEFIANGEGVLISGQDLEGNYVLTLGMSRMGFGTPENGYEQTYYLQLSIDDIDTITVYATKTKNHVFLSKFIYNKTTVFDDVESRGEWNGVIVK